MQRERMYLKEIAQELDYKDRRTVIRWCINNRVKILSDNGCKRKYVIKEEFEAAKSREVIGHLRRKYGANGLPEELKASMNFHSELMSALEDRKQLGTSKYKPSGDNEKRFLNSLTKSLSE